MKNPLGLIMPNTDRIAAQREQTKTAIERERERNNECYSTPSFMLDPSNSGNPLA